MSITTTPTERSIAMADAHEANLHHALADDCTDPDCEIHHPDVGVMEETITKTDLAFWIAGYYTGARFVADQAMGQVENIYDELVAEGIVQPKEDETDEPEHHAH
jgi:hypothetical protein